MEVLEPTDIDITKKQNLARIAGRLYLAVILLGYVTQIVQGMIVVPNDIARSAENLIAFTALVRFAALASLCAGIGFAIFSYTMYLLFFEISPHHARLMVIVACCWTVLTVVYLGHNVAAITVLHSDYFGNAFELEQVHAEILYSFEQFASGQGIARFFFGLCFVLLGLQMQRAVYTSRGVGVVLLVGGAAGILSSIGVFLPPLIGRGVSHGSMLFVYASELIFCVYLLFGKLRMRIMHYASPYRHRDG